jgi:N-acyl homoserine lactone hydrolase
MLSPGDVSVLHLADLSFPSWHPRAGEKAPANGFLIRHPDGHVVVDTGIGPPHPFIDRAYRPVRWPLSDVLADLGTRRASVSAVINTHLHFDHCGGNSFFAGVPIFVQAAELEAAGAADYTIREFVDFPGARYELLDGEADIAPGIRVVLTPHTPGHQSVVIETDRGRILIAGQALETVDELNDGGDVARLLLSLEPAQMLFSHDDRVWLKPGERAV